MDTEEMLRLARRIATPIEQRERWDQENFQLILKMTPSVKPRYTGDPCPVCRVEWVHHPSGWRCRGETAEMIAEAEKLRKELEDEKNNTDSNSTLGESGGR
jgi:hypothetical protein